MRFLFFANPTSIHTRRWVDGLRGRGHEVVVVPNNEGGRGGFRKAVTWIRLTLRLRRLAGRADTLLVVHWVPSGLRALVLMGLRPRVGVAWGSDIYRSPARTWRQVIPTRLQSAFLRGCDLVVGTSQALADAAIGAGAPPGRTRCLRFGVDIDRFRPGPDPSELRARLGLERCRVILSNRAIAPIYHQETVVEALARLPSDVVVVMTRHGADRAEVARVEALAEELGVVDRVRILSEVADDDMADLYRLADVVVSIPGSDGGASTVTEALACGRPLVATDLPSVREWLSGLDPHGLVPVGDAIATAQALERALARSSVDGDELAGRSRAAVEGMGDEQKALDDMERIHVELVGPSRPPTVGRR